MIGDKFYITPEAIYRLGNSLSSRLDVVRESDIDTYTSDGIIHVIANGNDISVFTKEGIEGKNLSGWVWELPANLTLPQGLILYDDEEPKHYCLAPTNNMPLSSYVGLLEQLIPYAAKVWKKTA